MHRIWTLHEVQLTIDEVDHLFLSAFKSSLRMIGQGQTYWSKATCTLEGGAGLISAH
jgi:hypothetical protein